MAGLSTGLLVSPLTTALESKKQNLWFMPEESVAHVNTWMAFIANDDIWGQHQIPEVQRNLVTIAKTIAKYEPVSILVRPQDYALAETLFGDRDDYPFAIDLIAVDLNDLWLRDTGPTFVFNTAGEKAAIDFNFNGWGEDQEYNFDAKVAGFIAQQTRTKSILSSLTLEGGCFEVDGAGTAIMTESCIVNDNRNPNKTKKDIEIELKSLLGLDKIIWIKGIKGKEITDGHTDFYARFAKPGTVVVSREMDNTSYDYTVTRENIAALQAATDAKGRTLHVEIIDTPKVINAHYGVKDFAAGYIGYYVCNNAVIMQKFGDKEADEAAKKTIQKLFPERKIEQIMIDGIASGGGSIHCTTQQEPATYWRM
jgi:agmatine deiminase